MVVTCHNCAAKFRVDDSKIGARGVKVRCAKCQTMIIVRPPEPATVIEEAEVMTTPSLGTPTIAASQDDGPTRIMTLPDPKSFFDMPIPGASNASAPFGDALPGMPSPDDDDDFAALPPPAFAPPPLKAPSKPPIDDAADLFSDPFAKEPFAVNAPTPAVAPAQGFVDAGNDAGPALELDLPSAQAADALAEMPHFDDAGQDEAPSFEGGMSADGNVTKPFSLQDIDGTMRSPQQAVAQLDLQTAHKKTRETSTTAAIAEHERKHVRVRGSSKIVAFLGRVAIVVLCLAGLAGELMVFRTGGLRGILSRASLGDAYALRRVVLYPMLAQDGTAFVIVRGEVQGDLPPGHKVEITLDGKVIATVAPGASVDDLALFTRSDIQAATASDPRTFRYAWKDTRPIDTLKAGLLVRIKQ